MRVLYDGRWKPNDAPPPHEREAISTSAFRGRISADGPHPPRACRYHLYASWACPFAHRALIGRIFGGLETAVGLSILHPRFGLRGWTFDTDFDGTTGDRCGGRSALFELYRETAPHFRGRVTTPVLWDDVAKRIVSNDSAEILRIFNRDFRSVAAPCVVLAPEVADWDACVSQALCIGVYRAGFAQGQAAYDAAWPKVVATLDAVESCLVHAPFLGGETPSETDVKLFCTLVRWDMVYATVMKCGMRRMTDLPNCIRFIQRMIALPGVATTVWFNHIRRHYFDDWPEYDHTVVPGGREDESWFIAGSPG